MLNKEKGVQEMVEGMSCIRLAVLLTTKSASPSIPLLSFDLTSIHSLCSTGLSGRGDSEKVDD